MRREFLPVQRRVGRSPVSEPRGRDGVVELRRSVHPLSGRRAPDEHEVVRDQLSARAGPARRSAQGARTPSAHCGRGHPSSPSCRCGRARGARPGRPESNPEDLVDEPPPVYAWRLNYERLYDYRFRDVNQDARAAVWAEIGPFIHRYLGRPERLLDPAAGRCEFLNAVPSRERWGVDLVDYDASSAAPGVKMLFGDVLTLDLPSGYFDAIWVSNFLEHLATPEEVARFLERMLERLVPGGRIAIMGPNFRYCAKDYFDCADHSVILTHVAVEEHLYAAGFAIESVVPRFLPYSFRSRLPARARLTRAYLNTRLAWRLLGKQFLVVGRRPI